MQYDSILFVAERLCVESYGLYIFLYGVFIIFTFREIWWCIFYKHWFFLYVFWTVYYEI